jgi:cytochrome P450
LYTLSQRQEIQRKLRDEVKDLKDPTFEQIESCRYLNNVCREMLRFAPPGTPGRADSLTIVSITTRIAKRKDQINGVVIPRGTLIFLPIAAINFDETVWGDDIDDFNPDRWEKLPSSVSNYNYLTFLQGPRGCIGRKFAETEMKALLVKLVQNIQFDELFKGHRVEKTAIITTRPKGGMHLILSPAKA